MMKTQKSTIIIGIFTVLAVFGLLFAACGDSGGSDTLPALSGTVSIIGTAEVGSELTADTSALGGGGTISYQWKQANSANTAGTNIGGATTAAYRLVDADEGKFITVTVTRSGYSGSKTSEAIGAVTASGLPVLSGTVSITGDALVGETLSANTSALGGSGTISYQWKRANSASAAGTTIGGATLSTYQLVEADEDKYITVTVTRSGNSGSKTSDPTEAVAASGLTGIDAEDFGRRASIDNIFDVGSFSEWNTALSAITSGGNNKNYIINIIADFYITTGRTSNNFGNVSGVKVSVRGAGRTLTLTSSGSILRVGNEQTIILRDVTLRGYNSNSSYPVVYADNGGTFTMQSGKISDNTATSVSGVHVAVAATFNMNGGEISGNTSSNTSTSSIVGVYQYASFNMNGGKISGNTSRGTDGGVVVVSEGAFTMQDGEISGNTGRGVYFNSNETFTMKNGKISGNIGGGVYVDADGTFIMENGEISGNSLSVTVSSYTTSTYNSGGGVHVGRGNFVMQNGKISDNTVRYSISTFSNVTSTNGYFRGGGVYVGGTFTMEDGDISGNTINLSSGTAVIGSGLYLHASGGGVYATTFNMDGGVISGNTVTNTVNCQYPLAEGGGVYATTFNMDGGVISGNTTTSYRINPSSTESYPYGGGVYAETFRIANGIIYGSNETDESLRNTGRESANGGQYGTFSGSVWNSNGTFRGTNYTIKVVNGVPYFGNSLANNYTFNTATTTDWDNALNAIATYDNFNYTINVTANFEVAGRTSANFGSASGITVTLQGTGRTITLSSNGNMIRTRNNQTVILKDLTLRGLSSNNTCVVYVDGGTFAMQSGKISGNTASNGGGVYVDSGGTFAMSGGEISGNTASSNGGGVYVYSGGTFRIVTGTIYGYGSNEVDSLRNTSGGLGSTLYGTAQYGTFTGDEWNKNGDLDSTYKTIRVENGVLIDFDLPMPDNYIFNVATPAEWNNTLSYIDVYGSNKNCTINVTADFSVQGRTTATFAHASNVIVTLQGPGRAITLSSTGYILIIGSNQTVILQDLSLRGHASNTTSVVYIYSNGIFTMNSGEISGNTITGADGLGGGVRVASNGIFTMNSGKISSNTVSVSGNGSSFGGGVYVAGTFTMNGGEISGNTVSGTTISGGGGGVFVYTSGIFTKTGGTITGYASDTVNGNAVKNSSGGSISARGHAVCVSGSPEKRRERTAGPEVNLDSSVAGATGGWEN